MLFLSGFGNAGFFQLSAPPFVYFSGIETDSRGKQKRHRNNRLHQTDYSSTFFHLSHLYGEESRIW